MACDHVQFQKGLSLNEFLKDYGTEEQCFEALFALRWPDGFHCPHCGHDKCCQLTVRKLQQCNRCRNQTSITAGTIFESTKLSLTVWFQGMYLLTQNKKSVSAMSLRRQLGISYNAAWRMKHKLMQVMLERDHDQPLSGFIQADGDVAHSVTCPFPRYACSLLYSMSWAKVTRSNGASSCRTDSPGRG